MLRYTYIVTTTNAVPESNLECVILTHGAATGAWQGKAARALQGAILALVYAAPAAIILLVGTVAEPDTWWHLRTAEWMLQHRLVPHTDPFTSDAFGRPWQAYSWAFDLLLYGLHHRLGLAGLILYAAGMFFAITVVLHRLLTRLNRDAGLAMYLTGAAMAGMLPLGTARPWLCTILCFVVELYLIVRSRQEKSLRPLLWLPLVFTVWANLHIQFVNGLLVLLLFAADAFFVSRSLKVSRRYIPMLLLIVASCFAATILNPYGVAVYRSAYALASQPGIDQLILELQAMSFRQQSDFWILLLALGAVGAMVRDGRFRLFESGLLVLSIFLSFHSLRDVWLTAVVGSFIIAGSDLRQHRRTPGLRPSLRFSVVAALLGIVLLVPVARWSFASKRLEAQIANGFPEAAVAAVKGCGLSGPLYNTYAWGGYLMWTLRMPVAVDGRAALHGTEQLKRLDADEKGKPGWSSNPALVAAGVIITPRSAPLTELLRLDSRFKLFYEDKLATVFVPVTREINCMGQQSR